MLLPAQLNAISTMRLSEIEQSQPENLAHWQGAEREMLERTLGLSDFVADSILRDKSLLPWLLQHLAFQIRAPHYRENIKENLESQHDEMGLMQALRYFRRREMLWLAWHDFNHNISLDESLSHLCALAEAIIMQAYLWLYQHCCNEWGTPCDEAGNVQPMLILGMGKLGGSELNFSSDIDLIFTYPENGQTQGARRSIANAQFFTRLGQRLIKALDQQTEEGFCYRVDMRLRPFGESGPLVMSFAALEDYYQEQGRDWERYAMIKARLIGEEQSECYQRLREMLRPFVFRRYIDFSAIQSLRRMKAMIQSEVRRRGLENNIKLGAGGIREIEFIVQSFQLIRGGREPILRKRGLFITLDAIRELALLPENDADILEAAYRYLRRVENMLQAIDDKQTQTLPDNERDQLRLTVGMNADSWQVLLSTIQLHMAAVRGIFDALVGDEDEKESQTTTIAPVYAEIWEAARDKEQICSLLLELNVNDINEKALALFNFKQEIVRRTLGPRGREVLNRLMPFMLSHTLTLNVLTEDGLSGDALIENALIEDTLLEDALIEDTLLEGALVEDDSLAVFERVLRLLARIATRTTYLELFDEHHGAIAQLVRLCSASPMVAAQLTSYPVLLDELLDLQHLYHPTSLTQYRPTLFEFLARIPQEDMEQQMEMIRQYKQSQLLRVAAADIVGVLPVMKVSDHLTYLAEAIVGAVVEQAWHQMVMKYGQPSHLAGSNTRGFAVIGYGKIGGLELGYGSDLDVVFLYDCPLNSITDGEKEIDGHQFYLKVAQRIVHLFSTRTTSGVLYDIDTRLRPSGISGMLVTTFESFQEYQLQQAWTWEHQALVRARLIYGERAQVEAFSCLRKQVLTQTRDNALLQKDVLAMRIKMRAHFGANKKGLFHIKHDAGGITDIEFLTQYLVLAHSHNMPKLTRWSDNVRILEDMATAGILQKEQAFALRDVYIKMRDKIHRLNLLEASLYISGESFLSERRTVQDAWEMCFGK